MIELHVHEIFEIIDTIKNINIDNYVAVILPTDAPCDSTRTIIIDRYMESVKISIVNAIDVPKYISQTKCSCGMYHYSDVFIVITDNGSIEKIFRVYPAKIETLEGFKKILEENKIYPTF